MEISMPNMTNDTAVTAPRSRRAVTNCRRSRNADLRARPVEADLRLEVRGAGLGGAQQGAAAIGHDPGGLIKHLAFVDDWTAVRLTGRRSGNAGAVADRRLG